MKLAKILVVDDDPNLLLITQMSLEFSGEVQVETSEGGAEALDAARRSRPDVVLLDMMMPKMDGAEVLRRLRAEPETSDVPVIFLTARAQEREIEAGLELGAAGYITKPYDPATLLDQVRAVLAEYESRG